MVKRYASPGISPSKNELDKQNQSRTNGPINTHLTIAQV